MDRVGDVFHVHQDQHSSFSAPYFLHGGHFKDLVPLDVIVQGHVFRCTRGAAATVPSTVQLAGSSGGLQSGW